VNLEEFGYFRPFDKIIDGRVDVLFSCLAFHRKQGLSLFKDNKVHLGMGDVGENATWWGKCVGCLLF
jgi:hypothetical protein